MSKPKTPMSDLYLGDPLELGFALSWSGLYHGYIQSRHRPLCGTLTTYRSGPRLSCERDIPSDCRPCKLCLAALRKAQKEEAKNG